MPVSIGMDQPQQQTPMPQPQSALPPIRRPQNPLQAGGQLAFIGGEVDPMTGSFALPSGQMAQGRPGGGYNLGPMPGAQQPPAPPPGTGRGGLPNFEMPGGGYVPLQQPGGGYFNPATAGGGTPSFAQVQGGMSANLPGALQTPLASGLPTYQDVLRNLGGGRQDTFTTPEMHMAAMQQYGQLLGAMSNARTQAGQLGVNQGQLGVAQGQLGLEGTRLLGTGGMPGTMGVQAGLLGIQQAQAQDALSHQTRVDTISSSILQQMAAQGQQITPEIAQGIRRSVAATVVSGQGGPGGQPGGAPPMPGVGGVGAGGFQTPLGPMGQGQGQQPNGFPAGDYRATHPPIGEVAPQRAGQTQQAAGPDTERFHDSWARMINAGTFNTAGTHTIDPLKMDQAITQFITQNPPTAQNWNSMVSFLLDRGVPQSALDAWMVGRESTLGGETPRSRAQASVRNAMNAIQPGFVGTSRLNIQSPAFMRFNPGNLLFGLGIGNQPR